jgi:uncharacterized oxidoreductase
VRTFHPVALENNMKTTGNTIVITGGGSGIGRGLAEALHKKGNTVIIAGRRQKALDAVTTANPGMKSLVLDVADPASIAAFAAKVAKDYPKTNVLLNNSGIMQPEDLTAPQFDLATAEATVATNLLGPIRLTAALLPVLRAQAHSTVIMVTSGLAFIPLAFAPTYCATKAAIHSYAESMRHQFRGSNLEVLELAPPYVATELMGEGQANDPRAMPLGEFLREVMQILEAVPASGEILVERVKPLRNAAANGTYAATFEG